MQDSLARADENYSWLCGVITFKCHKVGAEQTRVQSMCYSEKILCTFLEQADKLSVLCEIRRPRNLLGKGAGNDPRAQGRKEPHDQFTQPI